MITSNQPIKLITNEIKTASPLLHAGDEILLSGTIYTARDAAHKRIFAELDSGGQLPFELDGAVIYYAGPTPAHPGMPVGSCGPTTSSRMDPYAPRMLDLGLAAMIGKGGRNKTVCEAIVRNKAVYLCAIGGAGALACKCITSCEIIAYDDLGCESVKRMTLLDMPLFVGVDCSGGNLFATGAKA